MALLLGGVLLAGCGSSEPAKDEKATVGAEQGKTPQAPADAGL